MKPEDNVEKLLLYRVAADAFPVYPGDPGRRWMDDTPGRFAYRCLPMTIANSSGWEIICPLAFEATWDGGAGKDSLVVRYLDEVHDAELVSSHFGSGILTFRIGYVFRTAEGWGTWVRGLPNGEVDGIQPLEGLVETDWLPFTFTLNWKFTRPGTVRFERGTPVGFFTVVPYRHNEALQPVIKDISSDPVLQEAFLAWSDQRRSFNAALASSEPAALKQGWQRHYFKGQGIDGGVGSDHHVSRRRLKRVVDAHGLEAFPARAGDYAAPSAPPVQDYHRARWCSGDYQFSLGKVRLGLDP